MEYKLLQIFFVYVVLNLMLCADDNPCVQSNNDCGSCLRADRNCSWCKDENWTISTAGSDLRPRCNIKTLLNDCVNLTDLDGASTFDKNNDFSPKIQVKPQKVSLELRPGQPQSLSIKVEPAKNYPVNLYYLMDMSDSMRDDLSNLRTLGKEIAKEIEKITKNYKLGFGSFVDKTVGPFIQIERKNHPCNKSLTCAPTFGYKHVFNFNNDSSKFEEAIANQEISGNLDTPEGSFDALMQVAVCTEKMNWPKIDEARRIVVLVTDATPHIAGDAKIGGILLPNDGKCHLSDQNVYEKTNEQDYPSIGQLKTKLKDNKIVPIFAVTKEVSKVYKKLTERWMDLGARLGTLSSDSKNIVELIKNTYEDIARTVRLTNEPVEDLTVSYAPKKCRNSYGDSVCRDVGFEEEVEFTVTVNAAKCPQDRSKWNDLKKLKIVIPGFGDIDVDVKLICECPCEKTGGIKDSLKCNGTGTFQCGICSCDAGRYGDRCECDGFTKTDISTCKASNETEEVCSGMGNCICGKCVCGERKNAEEIISGRLCECRNFGCDRYEENLCGGSERGECVCGQCKCKDEYLGDNCGDVNCEIAEKNCYSPFGGAVCSDNGPCICGQCECNTGYKGKYCDNCVSCPEKCEDQKDRVLCLFGIGEKEVCDGCVDFDYRFVNETEEQCAYQVDERCYIIYSFEENVGKNDTVIVRREQQCTEILKKEQNTLAIVLGTIGGILLIGILLLLLWKFFVTAYDKYEYQKFEKDRKESKWANERNPLYHPSNQKFRNPAFSGNQ